jgi:hypothetical protein
MEIRPTGYTLSRTKLLLMVGLMLLSTVLFVAGVALERSSSGSGSVRAPAPQPTTGVQAGQEAQEGTEAREAQERQEAAPAPAQEGVEGTAAHEQAEQNRVFGIDVESPWVIAGVVLGTLLLIAALVVFGYRVLLLVLLVAVVATIFDGREVVYQLGQARYGVAALALGVVASRLATAIVAGLALRDGRHTTHPPVAPSRSVVP